MRIKIVNVELDEDLQVFWHFHRRIIINGKPPFPSGTPTGRFLHHREPHRPSGTSPGRVYAGIQNPIAPAEAGQALRALPLEGFMPEFKTPSPSGHFPWEVSASPGTPSPFGHFPWEGTKFLQVSVILLNM